MTNISRPLSRFIGIVRVLREHRDYFYLCNVISHIKIYGIYISRDNGMAV